MDYFYLKIKELIRNIILLFRCIKLFSLQGILYFVDLIEYRHYYSELRGYERGKCKIQKLTFQGQTLSYKKKTKEVALIYYFIVGRYVKGRWIRSHNIDINNMIIPKNDLSMLFKNRNKVRINSNNTHENDDLKKWKHTLSIVAIAKNEANYICEWCSFHKLLGIEKIYLYDNDSTDNTRDVLKLFVDNGFVVYNVIHGRKKQLEAYNDAIVRYGKDNKYMAFIDCDEFLTPLNPVSNIVEEVEAIFSQDINCGGIGLNWSIYGSSGVSEKPDGLVIENYLKRACVEFEENTCIKSIVKPDAVDKFLTPHYCSYRNGRYCINYEGDLIPSFWNVISKYQGIKINHYFCKSKEEYVRRRSLGKADLNSKRPLTDFYKFDRNEIYDDCALKYADKVKKIMKQHTLP